MRRDPLVQIPPQVLSSPSRAAGARFILGIDGGATKTVAAVMDLDSGAVHCAHAGPSNEDAVGVEAAVGALLQAARAAGAHAGATLDELAAAVVAVAGTDTDAVASHVRGQAPADWIVVNDVVAAWAAATGARPGIGAIAGTGSNVFGVGRDGRPWRAGGWGHLLGDEGSGYWLGIESIKAALRDRDGSGPSTDLSDAVPAFFGRASLEELAGSVYSSPPSKGEIAAFATETARLAHDGDGVALGLYARGAGALGGQIAAVIRHTGLAQASAGERAEPFPVGLIGSAFKAGAVLIDPLAAFVREAAPLAQVSVVEMRPVGGSLMLAARAAGRGDALDPAKLAPLLERTPAEPS